MARSIAQTAALAVGEGKAEMELLRHVKAIFLPRGCGTTLKIQGGIGKGGKGVLDYTIRVSQGIDYDRRVVLLDSDTDWDEEQRERASREEILVVESVPCLESWLLEIHGVNREASSSAWKEEFERRFGRPAHVAQVYGQHFDRDRLLAARSRVSTLNKLLSVLGV